MSAQAPDQRLAVLVVNQEGWAQDPFLRYAVEGDLHPLAGELRQLGFEIITLINQTPEELRKLFRKLHRRLQKAPVATFLFYYSGHADRRYLHMGKRQKGAYSYREFLDDFQKLSVERRFAIFDACFSGEVIRLFGSLKRYRQLLQEGRIKGVRQRSPINVSQLKLPEQGQEQGLRIITSSLQMSWELNRYRASVFTYHLLRGLRGAADLDKDGKISVDELFDFTSREVKQVTGQKPQQLVVARRARPYALAPAYRSRLTIGADVVGKLQVSVANFVWSHNKSSRRPLHLAVVHGDGNIQLQRDRRCWHQSIRLPKGGVLRLGGQWSAMPCPTMASLRQKGVLYLPARVDETAPFLVERDKDIALSAGVAVQGQGSLFAFQPAFDLSFRWRWLEVATGFSHGFAGERSFSLSRWFVQIAPGVPWTFALARRPAMLWVGGFLRAGLITQNFADGNGTINLHGVAGALVGLTWWFGSWGLRLRTSVGADYTPTAGESGFSLFWQFSTACVWSF